MIRHLPITGNGVFILDVTPQSGGIVGNKTYKANAPDNTVLATASSDTSDIVVHVGAAGTSLKYMPLITVNDVVVPLVETSTKRWFTGSVPISVSGTAKVVAIDHEGCVDVVTIDVAGPGPAVSSIEFGAYPVGQTALKANDTIGITVVADPAAVRAFVNVGGISSSVVQLSRVGSTSTFTGTVTVGSANGSQTLTAYAQNTLGTAGANFTSPALLLDQTTPIIDAMVVTYPSSHHAISTGESVTVTANVTSADVITYSGTNLVVDTPSMYAATKTVGHTASGYVTLTYTVTAVHTATNASTSSSTTIQVATVAPTASISIQGNPVRLIGSPTGLNYIVVITPSQSRLLSAPTLNTDRGTWSGNWTAQGNNWIRALVIADSTSRGIGTFSGLSMVGPSGIPGTVITAGANYVVGGISLRTLTYPAFSRVAPIGTSVSDPTKTAAQYTGGSSLVRYSDNGVRPLGYYPANADGSYNATGSYLGLSDAAFSGSNTTGTLQVDFRETA